MTGFVRSTSTIFLRYMILEFKNRTWYNVSRLLTPIFWLLFLGLAFNSEFSGQANSKLAFLGSNYVSFLALGASAMLLTTISFTAGSILVMDKMTGMMKFFISSPIPRSAIPIGNGLGIASECVIQSLIVLAVSLALGASFHLTFLSVFVFIIVSMLLSLGLYGLTAAAAIRFTNPTIFMRLFGFVMLPFMLGSNTFVPVVYVPLYERIFALVSPITHALVVIRYFMQGLQASNVSGVWGLLGLNLGVYGVLLSFVYLVGFTTLAIGGACLSFKRVRM